MNALLAHGSLALIVAWLLVGSLGVPLPEDAAILAAGVMIERGIAHPVVAIVLVVVSVLGGDAILFFAARRLGPQAYNRKLFHRLLPPERREKIDRAYSRYGGRLVFLARHVAGLRGAVFAMAGMHGMPARRFFFWDGLAACLSIPLVMALGYFGSAHIDRIRHGIAHVEHTALLVAAVCVLGFITWRHIHLRSAARRAP
jgi:membrane protein DedA with SNARE-associated domain